MEIVLRQVLSKNDAKNGALRRVGFQILGVTRPGEMEVLIIPVNPQKWVFGSIKDPVLYSC